MNTAAATNQPLAGRERYRRQGFRVWLVLLAVVLVWAALIAAPPILAANGSGGTAASIHSFFGHICHQIPERSLHLLGHQLAVCSRCAGVYFGLAAGVAVYPLWRPIDTIEPLPRFWLLLSLIPIGIDWSLTYFGVWENTHLSRFLTGTLLGVACGTFIVPGVVEIVRNFSGIARHPA